MKKAIKRTVDDLLNLEDLYNNLPYKTVLNTAYILGLILNQSLLDKQLRNSINKHNFTSKAFSLDFNEIREMFEDMYDGSYLKLGENFNPLVYQYYLCIKRLNLKDKIKIDFIHANKIALEKEDLPDNILNEVYTVDNKDKDKLSELDLINEIIDDKDFDLVQLIRSNIINTNVSSYIDNICIPIYDDDVIKEEKDDIEKQETEENV